MYNELYDQGQQDIWQYVQRVTETTSGEYTPTSGFTMPSQPITLPRPSGGVFGFSIGGADTILTDYQGYKNSVDARFDTAAFKGSYVAAVLDNKMYCSQPTVIPVGASLVYDMIPKFTSAALTDEIFIPGGEADHFLDRVIMTIRQAQPEIDMLNDNA
jgi:hypothetical protein